MVTIIVCRILGQLYQFLFVVFVQVVIVRKKAYDHPILPGCVNRREHMVNLGNQWKTYFGQKGSKNMRNGPIIILQPLSQFGFNGGDTGAKTRQCS